MTLTPLLKAPLEIDLRGLLNVLRHAEIEHRVTEEQGQQVLWVDETKLHTAAVLAQSYSQGDNLPATEPLSGSAYSTTFALRWWLAPITYLFIGISIVLAVITQLGENVNTVQWFSFIPFQIVGHELSFSASIPSAFTQTEIWRWFTPMFLHFGVAHIAMNSLWMFELGRRIERQVGSLNFMLLALLTGFIANAAQFIYEPSPFFGGLSGLIYALLGYCWIYNRFIPSVFADLPRAIIVMMLVWLVVCMTGILGAMGLGKIANAAHLGGLISGCLAGALFGWLAKRRSY
ncbi:rhomboid family intramembrane serine protease [Pseudomonas sp. F1_0610]|uniref:rhomboid family intramembrane serine protease n=1 Tax=Pseudomonas sp. F1_0610 TaxID=3114284 RepID=UPI0039C00960